MIRILVLLMLLGATAKADVLCVRVQTTDGSIAKGSAVVLDKTKEAGYVALTAAHVVHHFHSIWVAIDEKWVPVQYCTILKKPGDRDFDAAVLFFKSDVKFPKQKYNEHVQAGDKIWLDGFPGGGEAKYIEGVLKDRRVAKTEERPIGGQSGGAVYDDCDNLIGIVNTSSDGMYYRMNFRTGNWEPTEGGGPELGFTPIADIKVACESHWGFFWGLGCPPGGCPPYPYSPYPPQYQQPPQHRPPPRQAPPSRRPSPTPIQPVPDLGPLPAPAPDAPPPPLEVSPKPAEIDYDKLAKSMLEKLDLEKLRGPAGTAGKDGADGKPADESRLAAIESVVKTLEEVVPPIYDEVMALKNKKDLAPDLEALKAEVDRLRYTQIPVQFIDKDGTVFDRVNVRLDKRIPYDDPKLINSATLKMKKDEKDGETQLEKDDSASESK